MTNPEKQKLVNPYASVLGKNYYTLDRILKSESEIIQSMKEQAIK